MAQITVIYKDFEEMKAVARELLKEELSPKKASAGQVVSNAPTSPAMPTVPVTPTAPATPAAPTVPATPAVPAQTPGVPTSTPAYTRDDLSRAAMPLMDSGMQAQLMDLIKSYGVASLMDLPPEQYGSFATALRGLGAQI